MTTHDTGSTVLGGRFNALFRHVNLQIFVTFDVFWHQPFCSSRDSRYKSAGVSVGSGLTFPTASWLLIVNCSRIACQCSCNSTGLCKQVIVPALSNEMIGCWYSLQERWIVSDSKLTTEGERRVLLCAYRNPRRKGHFEFQGCFHSPEGQMNWASKL